MYKAEFFSSGLERSEAMIDASNGSATKTSKSTVVTVNTQNPAKEAGEIEANMLDANKILLRHQIIEYLILCR